tara:strand:- start:423 stop:1715 length:1293 start_codon:yes stop_codon:yes gene_type:complete
MSKPTGLLSPRGETGWTSRDATHLLWRTQFGASAHEIKRATTEGLAKTVNRLLKDQPETEEFRTVEPLLRSAALDSGNIDNLKAWWLHRMHYTANPLRERLALFWHNHFATSNDKVNDVAAMAAQNDLLRRESLGSFRRLLHGMAKDPAMLIWLDGNANRKRHANENFAREVMELFSLGEGNYSETDIKQAARAFTGWHVRKGQFWFNRAQHDFTDKTLFGVTRNLDGSDVVELCLAHKSCPRFLAFKLLRAFVLEQPTAAQVGALAARIREHNFEMTPIMRKLLTSKLFYSPTNRHALIKSPLQLVLGAFRALGGRPDLSKVAPLLAQLGQDIMAPPTVKGWEGGRLWITSATLLQRNNFAAALLSNQLGRIDTSRGVVDQFAELLLARDLPASRKRLAGYLKEAEGDPEERLRGVLHLITTMPEYQLT